MARKARLVNGPVSGATSVKRGVGGTIPSRTICTLFPRRLSLKKASIKYGRNGFYKVIHRREKLAQST